MKKIILFFFRIAAFFIFSIGFSGCDLFGERSISNTVEWPVYLTINSRSTNPDSLAYSAHGKFDSNYDPYIIRYKNKIKEFKVRKITYDITSFSAPPGVPFANGTLILSSSGKTIVSEDSMSFQRTYGETELTNINFDGLRDVEGKLNDNGLIELDAKGTLSSTQVDCALTVKFYVAIISDRP